MHANNPERNTTMTNKKNYCTLELPLIVSEGQKNILDMKMVFWSSIFVTQRPNFAMGFMKPHSVPKKAFCNYYKNADVHGYNDIFHG